MTSRSERSDAMRNREALLRAAAELLAEDPSASMDEIAARAGLGRATMYRHVTSRSQLLQQLATEALHVARVAVADARPADGRPVDALRRVIAQLADRAVEFRTLLALGVVADPAFVTQRTEVLAPVTELFARGRDSGELRQDIDPQWSTVALITLLHAAVTTGHPDPAHIVCQTLAEGWLPRPNQEGLN